MTSYDTIYEAFLSKIEDIDLPEMSTNDQERMLKRWLDEALGYIELDGVKIHSDLERDDNTRTFVDDLSVGEITVISMYMIVAWYDKYINSIEHTLSFWGSKDERWTDQKNHLSALISSQNNYRVRARKYYRNYASRHNSYIGTQEDE